MRRLDVTRPFTTRRTSRRAREAPPTVLKLAGELLDDAHRLQIAAAAIASLAGRGRLVVVHGGGREIDLELDRRGIVPQRVDGLRITDPPVLDVAVAVLAGSVNTRLVAAAVTAGVQAVGLTGADAGIGLVEPAPPYESIDGRMVDLGLVGEPANARPRLVEELCDRGYVPVVASIGLARNGQLLNVNADTFASHLAVVLGVVRLVLAGTTRGVLDRAGRTIPHLDAGQVETLISSGDATAGMVAKLLACRKALAAGVSDISIVDGRTVQALVGREGTSIAESPRRWRSPVGPGSDRRAKALRHNQGLRHS